MGNMRENGRAREEMTHHYPAALLLVFVLLAVVVFADGGHPLELAADEPLTPAGLSKAAEHVYCPEFSKKVVVVKKEFPFIGVECSGFLPAPEQPRLTNETQLYTMGELAPSLARARPRAALVRVTTRVAAPDRAHCGVATELQGKHGTKPDKFSFAFTQDGFWWRQESSVLLVPLDPDDPSLFWSWTFFGADEGTPTACAFASSVAPSNHVVLLGVFV